MVRFSGKCLNLPITPLHWIHIEEVVMHENVTDQHLLLPSSTIHWSYAFSNLLEVGPILLLAGVMQIKHQCGDQLRNNQSQFVYCSKCVNVVSLCCSFHAINTTIVLLYVMIYTYNIQISHIQLCCVYLLSFIHLS